MYKYHCLNPIADIGLNNFTEDYTKIDTAEGADALLVRSAVMHDMEFDKNLKAIGRAGAGVNNIPLDTCAEQGIVVFNTPGANANGVKELVIAGMLLASRDIIGGINWVQENEEDGNILKDAEKAKKQFAGCEIEVRSWESLDLEPLVFLLPMQPYILEWKFTDMIHICLWMQHGDCPEIFIMQRPLMSFIKIVIILRSMCRLWIVQKV